MPTAVSDTSKSSYCGHYKYYNADGPFPEKLYDMLEYADEVGLCDVVSWLSHGRAFKIHDADMFMSQVSGRFFKATKLRSIERQLLLWGFKRIAYGIDQDAWIHEHFLRGQPKETVKMVRTTTKTKSLSRAANAGRMQYTEVVTYMPLTEAVPYVPLTEAVPYVPSTEDELILMMTGDRKEICKTLPTLKQGRVSLDISPFPSPDFAAVSEPPYPMECRDRYPDDDAERNREEIEIEPLAIIVDNRQAHCNVDDFSLFIGQMIQDPSE